jgi:hypothetical protein
LPADGGDFDGSDVHGNFDGCDADVAAEQKLVGAVMPTSQQSRNLFS